MNMMGNFSLDARQLAQALEPLVASPDLPQAGVKPSDRPENAGARLRREALREATNWRQGTVRKRRYRILENKARRLEDTIVQALSELQSAEAPRVMGEVRWIVENARLLRTAAQDARRSARTTGGLIQSEIRRDRAPGLPRCYGMAAAFLGAVGFAFDEKSFLVYFAAAQEQCPLEMGELRALRLMMQLVLLHEVAHAARSADLRAERRVDSAPSSSASAVRIPLLINSLRRVGEADWKDLFEQLSALDVVLREDPSGTYPRMDFENRNLYREAVQKLARHSATDELGVASKAVALARSAENEWSSNARLRARRTDVGYYLLDKGRILLERQIGFRPPVIQQVRKAILRWPEVSYLAGIEFLTLAFITFVLMGVGVPAPPLAALLLLLLPATESAIGVVNQLVAFFLPPRILPRLDFSRGIPRDSTTMVAIPTLLISQEQVRGLVHDLEVRYQGNRDANLHFALLTDPPDSSEPSDEKDELVELCSRLIQDLNDRYREDGRGGFFHFHRQRIYNASEGVWMGWERKRGKLLDFNNLLRGKYDSFPVKVGDLSILPTVRYVITLDSDTQLPRDAAHRLVSTLAHPLNRAVIDPVTNTVVEGYGILQPRVAISVRSASRSRLANIYSGQTGFDIYTRAVSDVYQDLFGEAIFAGKGIYEVDVFQQVLGQRFPCNAILSHDLIEGAYTRVGLVTDVEVIDDYPSHFSAYTRRKHRWVRGDWQIMRWLFSRVPAPSGDRVPNPLSLISRWKILDNLRRSVIEIATFALLVAAWFFFPGATSRWTAAVVALMLIPSYVHLMLSMTRIPRAADLLSALKEVGGSFVAEQVNVLLMFTFLAHQTLVTLDAVVRTLVRLTVTHQRLLEWETAAQSELQTETRKRIPVDVYLDWTPHLGIGLALALTLVRPKALFSALPVLALWVWSKFLSRRLDAPLLSERVSLRREEAFLRQAALRTWRFFRFFATAEHHWLIPDNYQEEPAAIASRISPTNLGLLLNAQLAAYDLGFLTLPQFVNSTECSLTTAKQLPRFRGHFFNWYDTRSLAGLEPLFVSTVDSGNLACCLWTLRQGCLQAGTQPLFRPALFQGISDHLQLAAEAARAQGLGGDVAQTVDAIASKTQALGEDPRRWIQTLPALERMLLELDAALSDGFGSSGDTLAWWVRETGLRLNDLRVMTEHLAPWLLPEYAARLESLGVDAGPERMAQLSLESLPQVIADLDARLESAWEDQTAGLRTQSAVRALRSLLPSCLAEAERLENRLRAVAEEATLLVDRMDFRFLYNQRRNVLSVGYHVRTGRVEESCYELLASEARTAAFVAIAKGDVPQESWFRLGRAHTLCEGRRVLLSWTGTMFEYLMPTLWMKAYPGTILDENAYAAVVCQKQAGTRLGIPWGISEAACSRRDDAGHYQYYPFGLRALALRPDPPRGLVVSPYSSFLALPVDPAAALRNLHLMQDRGWVGEFGFYESAEFAGPENQESSPPDIVRCWMAHHQGMILLSVCNLLSDSLLQNLFHEEPRVAATERILHERVPLTAHVDRSC